MAFLHRQRHSGLWLAQMGPAPGMAVEIDTAHPLASGLAGFWLLRDGRDLTNGAAPATPQTGAVFGVGAAGPSLAAGQLSSASQLSAFDAQAYSLWIGFNQSSSNPSQVVLRKDDNNGQHGWWIELNGSGAISLTAVGSQNASLSASASGWSTARSLNGALITSDRALDNGAVLDFYGDGARWGGGTLGGTGHLSDATYPLWIGNAGFSGNIYAVGIWRRQLTADDAAWLNAGPFAMLRPVARRTYIALVSGDATVSPGAGAIVATGALATRSAGSTVAPGAGSAALQGATPTVTAGSAVSVSPGAGSVALQGAAAVRAAGASLAPGAGSVTVQGAAPSVLTGLVIAPGAGGIVLQGAAAVVAADAAVSPGAGGIVLQGAAPSVGTGGTITVTPGPGGIVLAGDPPSVQAVSPPAVRHALRYGNKVLMRGPGVLYADMSPPQLPAAIQYMTYDHVYYDTAVYT